jgi:serine/threonine protein kinase
MSLLDDYTLSDVLGRGSVGVVYRAHDRTTFALRAIKTIKPELLNDPFTRSEFTKEYERLSKLNHPNIVRVYGMGEDSVHGLYYIMEYHPDGDLTKIAGNMGDGQKYNIWLRICAALQYSHLRETLHRDIKAQNIILKGNQPILVDFGVGVSFKSNREGTTATGSDLWASIYQQSGDTSQITDIYSLAGILGYLLTKCEPRILHGLISNPDSDESRILGDELRQFLLTAFECSYQNIRDMLLDAIPIINKRKYEFIDIHIEQDLISCIRTISCDNYQSVQSDPHNLEKENRNILFQNRIFGNYTISYLKLDENNRNIMDSIIRMGMKFVQPGLVDFEIIGINGGSQGLIQGQENEWVCQWTAKKFNQRHIIAAKASQMDIGSRKILFSFLMLGENGIPL